MKKKLRVFLLIGALMLPIVPATNQLQVYATELGEDGGAPTTDVVESGSSEASNSGLIDGLRNYNPVTTEQYEKANNTLAPLLQILGVITSGLVILGTGFLFVFIILGYIYVIFGFSREILGGQQGDVGGSNNNGFDNGSVNAQTNSWSKTNGDTNGDTKGKKKWLFVPDSALIVVTKGQQMGKGTGSMLKDYTLSMALVIVLFFLGTTILTSSALIGTGLNLGQWGIQMIGKLNGSVPR